MHRRRHMVLLWGGVFSLSALAIWAAASAPAQRARRPRRDEKTIRRERLLAALRKYPHRILYESWRGRDWDIMTMNADGSKPANLTRNTEVDEMYPHASPDGSRIVYLVDEGRRRKKVRNVYCMDADGSNRTLIARNARHPCWSPDGKSIAYTPNEYRRYSTRSYATRYIEIYELASGERRRHPNERLHHLYALKWSPDGKWFFATVYGGMGYRYGDLAIEAEGVRHFKLKGVDGCRPDFSPDGKRLLWNLSDQAIAVADLDLSVTPPKLANGRKIVTCAKKFKVYHGDFSPDGKYIAFSHGPAAGAQDVGSVAKGWHIWVADASQTNVAVRLTTEGVSNKEPDWLPVLGRKKTQP